MRNMMMAAVGGVMLMAGSASAQRRYEGPLPAEIEWTVTNQGEQTWGVDVKFRNASGYTRDGFWSLSGLFITRGKFDPAVSGWLADEQPTVIGNVDLRDLGGTSGNPLLPDFRFWGGFDPAQDGSVVEIGASPIFLGVVPNEEHLGMLGCAIPINVEPTYLGPFSQTYAGRTCAREGYDGWLGVNLIYSRDDIGFFELGNDDVSISPVMTFTEFATIPVPTPGTMPLLVAGLMGLNGVIRRRRREHLPQ